MKNIEYYFRKCSDDGKIEKVKFNRFQFATACEQFGYTYPFMDGIEENLAMKLINYWNKSYSKGKLTDNVTMSFWL